MANIAQTVNVLQALVLTEGDRVVTTPTYHVYDLYKVHQGAQAIRPTSAAPEVAFDHAGEPRPPLRPGRLRLPARPHPGLDRRQPANRHAGRGDDRPARCRRGRRGRGVALTHADIHAHNTFDAPETVALAAPRAVRLAGAAFTHTFAPQSVTRLLIPLA